jgi:hypothetical protein
MRIFRSLVLGLVLVILSPLGWGEDVYYCVVEHTVELEPTESGNAYELNRYKPEPFTFKYEADSSRLAFKGRAWAGDELYYLVCRYCTADGFFDAGDGSIVFKMNNGRFNYAAAYYPSANMKTGTCTKF